MSADLQKALQFPQHIAFTQARPDIVLWSDTAKKVVLVELTVPWEENMEEAYERKMARYEPLRADCEDNGWHCAVVPVEVGCRGFIGRSTLKFLSSLGLDNKSKKLITSRLQRTTEYASRWIWSKARQNEHDN